MALVWHEKASRAALQTSSVNFTNTLLVQTHTHDVSAPWSLQICFKIKDDICNYIGIIVDKSLILNAIVMSFSLFSTSIKR